MRGKNQATKKVLLWCCRLLFCATCFVVTYFLIRKDSESQLPLALLFMPLVGFLAGILITLIRKRPDWWFCVALILGWLILQVAVHSFTELYALLPAAIANCLLPCALFALTSLACNGILQKKQPM